MRSFIFGVFVLAVSCVMFQLVSGALDVQAAQGLRFDVIDQAMNYIK